MPGMNLAEMFAQNQGNGFSGSYPYQPTLRPMQANPVAQMPQMGGVPAATAEGIGQVKRSMAKVAMPRGLGDVPSGVGPQQMNAALAQLGQARALVDPSATLQSKGLSREDFDSKITELAGRDEDKYNFSEMRKDPQTNSIIKGLIGAIAGGGLGYLGGGLGGGLAGAGLGGAGGAGIGYLGAQNENRKLHDTAKVLKEYGLLKPEYLRQALPLLKAGSQDNSAQRLSSAGESSGVSFKHDDEGHATGASAFDTLDGYMKKAGLNSFQTQFFSRMIESGMPESMIAATVKTAGDRFGAKVQAELQDGLEKIADLKKGLLGLGKAILGQGAKKTTKKVGPAMGRNLPPRKPAPFGAGIDGAAGAAKSQATRPRPITQDMQNVVDAQRAARTIPKPAAPRPAAPKPAPPAASAAQAVPGAAADAAPGFWARQNQGARRAAGAIGDYFGSQSLRTARRQGLGAGLQSYGRNLARGAGGRAATGAFYGATDPGLGDSNTSIYDLAFGLPTGNVPENFSYGGLLANTIGGITSGVLGGRAGQRAQWRSMAGQGLGEVADLVPGVDGMAQTGRNLGLVMPSRMPVLRNGKIKNLGTELGTGPSRTAKAKKYWADKDVGILDKLDPLNAGAAAVGRGGRALKDKVLKPGLELAKANPTAATLGGLGTAGLAGAGYLGNRAVQSLDDMGLAAMNASSEVSAFTEDAKKQMDSFGEDFKAQLPDLARDAASQVSSDLLGGIKSFGGNVAQFAESIFGEGTADYLANNWPMLLAGLGIGGVGGAMMGGGKGALLGGIAAPLALLFAQQQGLLPSMNMAQGGQGQGQGQGQLNASQAAAQATNLTGTAAGGTRSELEANQSVPGDFDGNGVPDGVQARPENELARVTQMIQGLQPSQAARELSAQGYQPAVVQQILQAFYGNQMTP